ncbi:D-2-hydroxyacid dehydrogenase [Alkalicoccobacillus murimartini]|uniref:Phosphoglycerate dehydrogenase-like enzyme n=1 Tax=Alkalicoccobacillus murimartini TaxID=171685 RepID=A0ABT9YKI0_9BACI|nr:D-2-hydroxyacid dehydrogenase [Alkalicoccobacillus murimartini]MDQ0208370.1 phosphoglycerate dehydrogenase-like enzyme [Alkalicoccobacillus murimartini]
MSTNKQLVITHDLSEESVKQIQEVIPEWSFYHGKDSEKWESKLDTSTIIVGWKKQLQDLNFAEPKTLQWLQTWSAGVDYLPLEEMKKGNIAVTSANGVHAYPISETIFALMLGLTRKIHAYVRNQQTKTWEHENLKLEIHEKTIGVIGVGEIGKETAKISKAFGMNVLGVRHSGKEAEYVDEMYTPDQLAEVLPQCDYVVVTLPLTPDTHHLFNKEVFQLMKKDSFFINIGRGEIVHEADLVDALREGNLAGAGLDVFEKEPLEENSPLWDMENVIITPHTAGATEHYQERVIEEIFIPNLKQFIKGESPSINLVDYNKGY